MQKYRPEIFEKASELIHGPRAYNRRGVCVAIRKADWRSPEGEKLYRDLYEIREVKLFTRMHKPKGPEGHRAYWLGDLRDSKNQRLRKQLCAEVALNLKAQGFAK